MPRPSQVVRLADDERDEIKPLLIGVVPHADESLMSLVSAACVANEHERTAQILAFAGVDTLRPAFAPFTRTSDANAIATVLSASANDVVVRMHPKAHCLSAGDSVAWYGASLPRSFLVAEQRRVSPAALRASPHHRASWMVRPLTYCPETFELLISSCPYCSAKLGWLKSIGVWRCETCTRSLRHHRPGKITWSLRQDAASVAALVSVNAKHRAQALARMPGPFNQWAPGDVFFAAVEIGSLTSAKQPPGTLNAEVNHGDFSNFGAEDLVRGFRALCEWPLSLKSYVEDNRPASKADLHHVKEVMGPLAKFFSPYAKPTPLGDLIQSAVPPLLHELEIPVAHRRYSKAEAAERSTTMTTREAQRHFNLDGRSLSRIGGIDGILVSQRQVRAGAKLFKFEPLKNAVYILRGSISEEALAAQLAIPPLALPALARAGLLDAVEHKAALLLGGGGRRYVTASADRLLSALDNVPVLTSAPGPSLAAALAGKFNGEAWARALGDVLAGKLKVVGKRDIKRGFARRVVIEPKLARAMVETLSSACSTEWEFQTVTSGTASLLLGIHERDVADAIEAQLVEAYYEGRGYSIELGELVQFSRSFMAAWEVARRLNITSQSARSYLQAAGIEPDVSLSKIHLWRREEVELALSVRATSTPEFRQNGSS